MRLAHVPPPAPDGHRATAAASVGKINTRERATAAAEFSLTFEARSNFERSDGDSERGEGEGNDIIALKGEDDERREEEAKEEEDTFARSTVAAAMDDVEEEERQRTSARNLAKNSDRRHRRQQRTVRESGGE